MTLTTRLSVFFLAALAAVLIGFSATLYLLARSYLHRQIDDRLEAALNVLSATAEIKPNGVEWEARERPVSLQAPPGEETIAWMVRDERGRVIDGCREDGRRNSLLGDEPGWRVRSWRLPVETDRASGSTETLAEDEEEKDKRHRFLILSAGLPLHAAEAAARNLLLVLSGLSVFLWLSAALVGGWLCRRALAPVRRMAEAAGDMNAVDPAQRLPAVNSGDELQELNRAFNQLLARWQESFEQQRRFTGDASHQLRTPLAAMLGQIDIALRRPRAAAEYQQVLGVLREQSLQMRQIVETLLFLARADAEAKSPQLQALELRAWLTEHLARWSGQGRTADLRTEMAEDKPLWVRAQAPLLSQLVDNLLENACKYSTAGTPITVSLSAQADEVCLTVADTGRGIAEEDILHIFEPFYRSCEARRQGVPGLGLGLAVAQRIAAALGGTLRVHSTLGKGTRFMLRLSVLPQI